MAFSKSVQFRGIKNAIKAYENNAVPAWGLFQNTQFLAKYNGDDIEAGAQTLRDFLNALDQHSADTNTYTLCVYEDLNGAKITSATKYDGSFNFRLADNIEDHLQSKYEARIAGLEAELEGKDEKPEAVHPVMMLLTQLMQNPAIQQVLVTKVLGFVDGLTNTIGKAFSPAGTWNGAPGQSNYNYAAAGAPAAIGNVNTDTENAKLQEAVNILVGVDPALGTNLLKLAKVAEKDPAKYNSLISMLNLL